jgi:hypothetical protein
MDKLGGYAESLKQEKHLHHDIRIETCAVWDTVMSLFKIKAATKVGSSNPLAFVERRVPDSL